MRSTVYLSLGGNQGDVVSRLKKAMSLLSSERGIAGLRSSHFYRTTPVQMKSSFFFVNAVCSFETELSPQEVFRRTQAIEKELGKVDKLKNADRPIDIDMLFYGQRMLKEKELEIPHPRWKGRLFVLIPLEELTKEIVLDGPTGLERYVLRELIEPLLIETPDAVEILTGGEILKLEWSSSLLEKNIGNQ